LITQDICKAVATKTDRASNGHVFCTKYRFLDTIIGVAKLPFISKLFNVERVFTVDKTRSISFIEFVYFIGLGFFKFFFLFFGNNSWTTPFPFQFSHAFIYVSEKSLDITLLCSIL